MSKNNIYLFILIFLTLQNVSAQEYRSIDGYGNNEANPDWGMTNALLKRVSPADYIDGISIPKLGEAFNKPNPRVISNVLFSQDKLINSEQSLSDYTWVFGQFIDHDLTFILDDHTEFLNNIVVPQDDRFFQPGLFIPMSRSLAASGTGTDVDNPRNYNNTITSYLDGSGVYGSTQKRADWLRTFEGGKLKVSEGNLLPWNTLSGEHNASKIDSDAPHMDDGGFGLKKFFIAGDARANENPLLLSIHTVFVREHNRLCEIYRQKNPFASDEEIYQYARRMNIAYLQHITYEEWLPAMGVKLPPYRGYRPDVKVEIFNEFSAAAFRFGHTLINSNLIRMEEDGEISSNGNITLKDAFFNPYVVVLSAGIESFFKGMATQVQQELDCKVIDDVRNFLFGAPSDGGLDLAAININRGRERGLSSYNEVRRSFGLPAVPSFYDLTSNHDEAELLEASYGSIENLDLWVGLLAETHMDESMMGRLMQVIIKEQFQLLRDGDRYYYEADPLFTYEELEDVSNTSLRDIIMRNTDIKLMQDNVFTAMSHDDIPDAPEPIPVDLDATLYPTIVQDLFNLNVFANYNSEVTLQIINMNGAIVSETTRFLQIGENKVIIAVDSDMPHGIYNVLIYNEASYTIRRFVKG
jgi:hypothetical protein